MVVTGGGSLFKSRLKILPSYLNVWLCPDR